MAKLTKEARTYCRAALEPLEREELVAMLENIGVACFDEEDASDDFIPAIIDSIEAGDIDFQFDNGSAHAYGHEAYMAWLDIEEVWED